MRVALFFGLLALTCGCFYSFSLEQKSACPASGECVDGFVCLGGRCVNASQATCVPYDRRCVENVAWTCKADGFAETGEDCAAEGKVCASGSCLKACKPGCDTGETCDPNAKACIPQLHCVVDSDCRERPGQGCFGNVCVVKPSAVTPDNTDHYPPAASTDTYLFDGDVKGLDSKELAANGQLLEPALAGVASDSITGAFKTGVAVPVLTFPKLRWSADHGIAPGLHYGPQMQTGNKLTVLALSQALLGELIAGENANAVGPEWDVKGRGIVVGQVRDGQGGWLSGATVGFSVPVGRMGYLGKQGSQALQRQGAPATAPSMGKFVAFDVPVGVTFDVVVVVRRLDSLGTEVNYVFGPQQVTVEAPTADGYGVTTLDVGRGAPQ